jgi:hypothetical protein
VAAITAPPEIWMIRMPEARPNTSTPSPNRNVGRAALDILLLKLSNPAPHHTGIARISTKAASTTMPMMISRPVSEKAMCRE